MANQKIIERKAEVVNEIAEKMKNSASYVLFEYRGLTVSETNELRRKLRESGSDFKVYKNTLTKRALDSLNINIDEHLNGPKAIAFGTDAVAPIKALSEFAKSHTALEMKVGVVDGEIADQAMLNELSQIPSREGLLTMFAGGLIEHVKNFAICLDLHANNLEKKKKKKKEEYKMAKIENKDIIEALKEKSLLEIKELVDMMKEEFGVDPSAVAVAAAPVAGAAEEGPSSVNVVLASAGANKIAVIKLVREITGLGLKEAKDIADNGGAVKENVSTDEANEIKAKFEEAGATIELK